MIYLGKVNSNKLELADVQTTHDAVEFLKEYKPKTFQVKNDSSYMDNIKRTQADCFISGEMKHLVRKNNNVISRDSLVIDIDDTLLNADELKEKIHSQFKRFSYALYPTLSNGIKGVRYRFVLPVPRGVDAQEYKLLVLFFNKYVLKDVISTPDDSNGTFSQLQGLPVITQYNAKEDVITHRTDVPFPLDDLLIGAYAWQKDNQETTKHLPSVNSTGVSKRYRTATTELFEKLVSDCGEGNRNNRIAQITGGLLVRCVDIEKAWVLVQYANQNFKKPLSSKELEKTFLSIAKKELGVSE